MTKKHILFLIIINILFITSIKAEEKNYIKLEQPENNNNYFNNLTFPITDSIADPHLIKVDNTYYVYSTECRGIKITKSTDFKNWEVVTNKALENIEGHGCFWAPEVYYYNNKYYMFYTTDPEHKIYVAISDNPEGPFTNQTQLNIGYETVIDASLLFDDDGKIYIYYKKQYDANNPMNGIDGDLFVEEMNADLMSVKENSTPQFLLRFDAYNGSNNDIKNYWERYLLEGPFVIKRNNKYYLMYSTGTYRNETYTLGYAVGDTPTGPFTKKTLGNGENSTPSLLHGAIPIDGQYDSTKNLYATGHHSVLKINDNEMIMAYHSDIFVNNVLKKRKLNFDYVVFDDNGNMYVNGPSTINQPLPSGAGNLYKIDNKDYEVKTNNNVSRKLNNSFDYNVNNSAKNLDKLSYIIDEVEQTNSVTINLTKSRNIEDIWLYSTEEGLNNEKADVIINDKYILEQVDLGNTGTAKIQLPEIEGYVKEIKLNFSNNIKLSEISLYRNHEEELPEEKPQVVEKKDNNQQEEKEVLENPKTGTIYIITTILVLGIATTLLLINKEKVTKNQ